jgi:hypothetical protein
VVLPSKTIAADEPAIEHCSMTACGTSRPFMDVRSHVGNWRISGFIVTSLGRGSVRSLPGVEPVPLLRNTLDGEYAERGVLIADFAGFQVLRRAICRLSLFHAVVSPDSNTVLGGGGSPSILVAAPAARNWLPAVFLSAAWAFGANSFMYASLSLIWISATV